MLHSLVDQGILTQSDLNKLINLGNEYVITIVKKFANICKPDKLTVISDSQEDLNYVKNNVVVLNEELALNVEGHTVHYDAFVNMEYHDQARDKEHTQVLISKGESISQWINTMEREAGLQEILEIMDGCMKGKECLVRFFCLGPKNSEFSILALQLTDSFYVAHSEDLLYRKGYEEFKRLKGSDDFFYFVHSAGELTGNPPVTKNLEQRRIYIDLQEGAVLSVNNQYAGNSLGLKKLALRLAIYKANNEDWLTEHYFIMGIKPKRKNRKTYVCGAFPSACGKTSTAMLPGQSIVGDDIAYLRAWDDGFIHAANIEKGIFGIIKDVNHKDDPVIFDALTSPRELIFSNVLMSNGVPYWLGMGKEIPKEGFNYSGEWYERKLDNLGHEIPHAHPNARYTIRLEELSNVDDELENPKGVAIHGIFYGGRDSDTMPPIVESLDWEHGVFLGATIESETTSATLGAVGVRKANPMANLDFLVIPLGKYLENHRNIGMRLNNYPLVFATNYFLKNSEDKYLNDILDKKVWLIWAEGRMHNDYEAITTPIGYIPMYEDLKQLFTLELNKSYSKEAYVEQFSIRIDNLLNKLDRMEKMYESESKIPQFFWQILNNQKNELHLLKSKGKSIISPLEL